MRDLTDEEVKRYSGDVLTLGYTVMQDAIDSELRREIASEHPDLKRDYPTVSLEMPAGSIGFVLGTCYHGAGTNTSGQDRVALTINYCNGSMRQQENLMLGVHPTRMLSFPKPLQDILGFKICNGVGHILAQDPRSEMNRHFGPANAQDPYREQRNVLHAARQATRANQKGAAS